MNIQGVEVLSEKIIYSPYWFVYASIVVLWIISIILFFIWIDTGNECAGISLVFIFILTIAFTVVALTDNPTFLNHPSKTQYEIEIIDDNAWKELGPNYTIKNKPYETKEIYVIEGDYIDDNT